MVFKNVYLNNTSTIVGPIEKQGPLSLYFDKKYDDYYMDTKTFEDANIKLEEESIEKVLDKEKLTPVDIDLFISGDLSNQIAISNIVASKLNIPYLGVYSACATSIESLILGAMFVQNENKKVLVSTSAHNNLAEKTYRYPVEYGGPKRKTATFTVTGGVSCIISQEKSNIKIVRATIGSAVDSKIKDVYNMGAVMAIAAANTILSHLKEYKLKPDYYDLILTGDLGIIGKEILKDYLNEKYNIDLKNLDDSACMIYDLNKQSVYSGGSGPNCLPIVAFSYILDKMNKKELKKVLLVSTGALMNPSMVNLKRTIPSISHAISLEVVNDIS